MPHNPAGEPRNRICMHTERRREHTASSLPYIGSPEWAFTHRAVWGQLQLFTLSNVPHKRRGSLPELGRGFQSDIGIVQEARGQRANLNFWTSQDSFQLHECSVMKQASFSGVEGTYGPDLFEGAIGWGSRDKVRIKHHLGSGASNAKIKKSNVIQFLKVTG